MRAVMDRPGTEDAGVLRRRDIRYLREEGGLTLAEAVEVVVAAEGGRRSCMVMVAQVHALHLFSRPYGAEALVSA